MFPPKPPRAPRDGPPLLEVRSLGWTGAAARYFLHGPAGEIVGLGGLDGQGQRELLLALFGVLRGVSGEVLVAGEPVAIEQSACGEAARGGMALIPEDRKTEGLMLPMSVEREPELRRARPHRHGGIDRPRRARRSGSTR